MSNIIITKQKKKKKICSFDKQQNKFCLIAPNTAAILLKTFVQEQKFSVMYWENKRWEDKLKQDRDRSVIFFVRNKNGIISENCSINFNLDNNKFYIEKKLGYENKILSNKYVCHEIYLKTPISIKSDSKFGKIIVKVTGGEPGYDAGVEITDMNYRFIPDNKMIEISKLANRGISEIQNILPFQKKRLQQQLKTLGYLQGEKN